MKPWRTPLFLRLYEHLPQATFDRVVGGLMRLERPRGWVRAVIAAWVRRGGIDLSEVVVEDWPTVEAFFLRRLQAGARPLDDGLVCPVDGVMVGGGERLVVKGTELDMVALIGGELGFEAAVATVFLTPDGYHHVHAPADLEIVSTQSIAGRSFPQNDDALVARPDVYLRNARVVVRAQVGGAPLVLVLVGASLISGIQVVAPGRYDKGERIGSFSFGSTVVLAWPRAWGACELQPGQRVRLGQGLGPRSLGERGVSVHEAGST